MKCETTRLILTIVLAVLAVAGVLLVLRTVIQTHELRSITTQATTDNYYLAQAQSLANDVAAYNQKTPSPELTKLIQSIAKPAAH